MIFPSNRVRIMVATKPVDFRKGHDGLAALVKNELHKDPFTGTVFVFRSRKADRLKLPGKHAHRHCQWPQAEPDCGTSTVELFGGVTRAKTVVRRS